MTMSSEDQALLAGLQGGDLSRVNLRAALGLRGEAQERLFEMAREARERHFPAQAVEVRSVIEVSNICEQRCRYCSINALAGEERYVISIDEFTAIVDALYTHGRRFLLIQSGENPAAEFITHVAQCVKAAKEAHPDLTLILSLGSLERSQYQELWDAGAERYVLKFETSNPDIYRTVKVGDELKHRLECIQSLADVGFQVGSGNIVGLPGETLDGLVDDLILGASLPLTMVSSSVFVPSECSDLHAHPTGDIDRTLNVMALWRLLRPELMIPSTSSLEKQRDHGQFMGLQAGANSVTIHDGTPKRVRDQFPIYSISRVWPQEQHIIDIVARAGLSID